MLYHPQLYLLKFENSISGVVLYLHVTDRPHLLMSGRVWVMLGTPQPQSPWGRKFPRGSESGSNIICLLSCQTGSIFAFTSWGQIASVFPKELLIWKIVSSPLNNCYHLISDSDWGCQHLVGTWLQRVYEWQIAAIGYIFRPSAWNPRWICSNSL